MPVKRLPNIGSAGVVKDLSQTELPAEAWTDALNVRRSSTSRCAASCSG